jgi:ubiquinone/menaquinone biosynthesis C-methylase UbiE
MSPGHHPAAPDALSPGRRPGRRLRPFPLLFKIITKVAPGAKPGLQKLILKTGYQIVSALDHGDQVVFLNFGYASIEDQGGRLDEQLDAADNLYAAQMYARVVGAVDVRGKDLLEVGCGRGGGAALVARHFQPGSLIGLDLAPTAIAFCRRYHRAEGLSFLAGDAENIPFEDGRFDAVVNVESSHSYPSVPRFLDEVQRVLRSGGHLLFADMRLAQQAAELRAQVEQRFAILEEERITPNVVRALQLDSARRLAATRAHVPKPLQSVFREFAGVEGSATFERFRTSQLEYVRFLAQRR